MIVFILILLIVLVMILSIISVMMIIKLNKLPSTLKKENEENVSKSISKAHEQLLNINSSKLQEVTKNNSETLVALSKINSEKLADVAKTNTEKLQEVLEPLNKELTEFKKRIEDINNSQTKQVGELSGRLEVMTKLYNTLSVETNNLTTALRGQVKVQGGWGEQILKSVLEASGFKKDTNYIEQATYQTEEGMKRPDIIIKLPEGRNIIIDAKLSLNSYVDYYNAKNFPDKEKFLRAMGDSFKKHIDSLANKEYYKVNEINSIKAVFIFIPIEAIFLILVDNFQKYILDAAQKNIYITTTTSLLPLLQLVDSMWSSHNQNKNSLEIARLAGKLYDKFKSMLDDFDKMRECINRADKQLDYIQSKLTGKDNLIRNVERLRGLGVVTSKNIPERWIDSCEEEIVEVEKIEHN